MQNPGSITDPKNHSTRQTFKKENLAKLKIFKINLNIPSSSKSTGFWFYQLYPSRQTII